jgi:hypothetical protein
VSDPIGDVVAKLSAIERRLPAGDGVRVFTRVYREVTERVRLRTQDGTFADPAFLVRLDVVFANVFLRAEEAMRGGGVPKAWAPLAEHRRRPGVLPVQFALAGMNAHINHDLAVAVVATCKEARADPRRGTVKRDYDRVNGVIGEVVRPIRQSFLDRVVVELGAPLSPVADLVTTFSLEQAREAAWVNALTLWELRAIGPLARGYQQTLASTVGMVGRQLLVPVAATRAAGVPPGALAAGTRAADAVPAQPTGTEAPGTEGIEDLWDEDLVAALDDAVTQPTPAAGP